MLVFACLYRDSAVKLETGNEGGKRDGEGLCLSSNLVVGSPRASIYGQVPQCVAPQHRTVRCTSIQRSEATVTLTFRINSM